MPQAVCFFADGVCPPCNRRYHTIFNVIVSMCPVFRSANCKNRITLFLILSFPCVRSKSTTDKSRRQKNHAPWKHCLIKIAWQLNIVFACASYDIDVHARVWRQLISARPRSDEYTTGICLETAKNTKAFE